MDGRPLPPKICAVRNSSPKLVSPSKSASANSSKPSPIWLSSKLRLPSGAPCAENDPSGPAATLMLEPSSAANSATWGSSTSPITNVGMLAAPPRTTTSVPSARTRTRFAPSTRKSRLSSSMPAGSVTTLSAFGVTSPGMTAVAVSTGGWIGRRSVRPASGVSA